MNRPSPRSERAPFVPPGPFVTACVALTVALGARAALPAPVTDNQRLLKVDLMVVTAHPDDEGMVAGTMARYALDEGRRVALVVCTRGEGGGNSTGKEYGPSLGVVREAELRACVGLLGVSSLHFLDRTDFGYTESAMATLERWSHGESLRRLVRLVRATRPEVMVTMDPAPQGGQHGHHQVAGRLATEAFSVAADPGSFPELSRDEGLQPWRVRKLYYGTRGEGALRVSTDTTSASRGRSYAEIAREALSHHRSQGFDRFMRGGFFRGPQQEGFLLVKSRANTLPERERDLFDGCDDRSIEAADLRVATERQTVLQDRPFRVDVTLTNRDPRPFRQVTLRLAAPEGAGGWQIRPTATANLEQLLPSHAMTVRFDVLPRGFVAGQIARLVAEADWVGEGSRRRAFIHVRAVPPVEVLFRPSRQLGEYRDWARSQRLDWLVERLPARAPLVIGDAAPVFVEVVNHTPSTRSGSVRLEVPRGWTARPAAARFQCSARSVDSLRFAVSLPGEVPQGDHDLILTGAGTGRDTARAEALPRLVPRHLSGSMPVDGEARKWSGSAIGSGVIPATAIVQGQVAGPSEASARFFVGYDATALQVLVEVRDNTVVTNIEPDDIRAHWRTSSVEICLDPEPHAENTLRTLKLGIFPWDRAGRVRAARDADARPGPVDRVDRGIRLASRRTATGYVVEARIPYASLPAIGKRMFQPVPGRRIGFNVILYHAGKKDAAIGEDANKARLAWAYRPGVWGRPASWGTLVFP